MGQHQDKRNGIWFYQFEHNGKLYKRSSFPSRRAAYNAEHKQRITLAQETGQPIEVRPSITLEGYFEIWMSEHVKAQCRPRTADLYRQVFESHIQPRIGRVSIRDLSRTQVKAMFAELDQLGIARNTIGNVLIPLRACLNAAKDDGLIDFNPADRLKRSTRARTVRESAKVQSYTKEELATILEGIEREQIPYGLLMRTVAHSGLRMSEVTGLRPSDIAEDHLWVKRGVQYAKGRLDVFAPKSGRARRVDIPKETASLLRGLRGEWCFPRVGQPEMPAHPEHVRDAWKILLAKLDLRPLRVHDLRHTYACLLLQAGAPPSYVKEQLGHSSIQVTVDIYGHMIPGANRRWVDQTFGTEPPRITP